MYLYPMLTSYYINHIAFIEVPLIHQFKQNLLDWIYFWERQEMMFVVNHVLFRFSSWT